MNPYYENQNISLYSGDALTVLKNLGGGSAQTCVTSPPYYGLRDYGCKGQIGLEERPEEYISNLVSVFREVRRVLRDNGTLWVNIGDSYCASTTGSSGGNSKLKGGHATQNEAMKRPHKKPVGDIKNKDLIGIPWMLAFALRADGWYLRQDIIWSKPNPMPESVTDRCTKSHEYIFLLSKSAKYYYNRAAIAEPHTDVSIARRGRERSGGKYIGDTGGQPTGNAHSITLGLDHCLHIDGANKRSVWNVPTCGYPEAHFATFPPDLIRPCIRAGTPLGGVVLDPFSGSGTTAATAIKEGRRAIGIELNPIYCDMSVRRITGAPLMLEGFDQ